MPKIGETKTIRGSEKEMVAELAEAEEKNGWKKVTAIIPVANYKQILYWYIVLRYTRENESDVIEK